MSTGNEGAPGIRCRSWRRKAVHDRHDDVQQDDVGGSGGTRRAPRCRARPRHTEVGVVRAICRTACAPRSSSTSKASGARTARLGHAVASPTSASSDSRTAWYACSSACASGRPGSEAAGARGQLELLAHIGERDCAQIGAAGLQRVRGMRRHRGRRPQPGAQTRDHVRGGLEVQADDLGEQIAGFVARAPGWLERAAVEQRPVGRGVASVTVASGAGLNGPELARRRIASATRCGEALALEGLVR